MTAEELKKLLALLGLIAIAGCGGGAADGNSRSAGASAISIKVAGSKGAKAGTQHGRIETYRVKVEGEGIAEPITAEFPGAANDGLIENVPEGSGRVVSVEAINPNGSTIRAGETPGVEVQSGTNEVEVKMEPVPIFTNLKNGATIDNTRLVMHIFSDPSRVVTVDDSSEGVPNPVIDADTNLPQLSLDATSGLGAMAPRLLPPGNHGFVVRDVENGRSSKVNVQLIDGTKRKPAPLFSASSLQDRLAVRAGDISK